MQVTFNYLLFLGKQCIEIVATEKHSGSFQRKYVLGRPG